MGAPHRLLVTAVLGEHTGTQASFQVWGLNFYPLVFKELFWHCQSWSNWSLLLSRSEVDSALLCPVLFKDHDSYFTLLMNAVIALSAFPSVRCHGLSSTNTITVAAVKGLFRHLQKVVKPDTTEDKPSFITIKFSLSLILKMLLLWAPLKFYFL